MTLTKAKIVEILSQKTGTQKMDAAQTIETLLEIMKRTLESGEDVLVSGFGKFSVKDKRERIGRNPYKDEPMTLAARRVVTFKSSGKLKQRVNGE
jgi:integration host factor subunit alpha